MPTIFGMFFSINEGFKTPNLNFTIKLRFDSRPNHLDLPSDRVWVKLCRSATEVIVTVENLLRPLSVIVEYWVNFFNSQNDQTFKVKKVTADLSNKYRNHEVFRYYWDILSIRGIEISYGKCS